MGKSLFIAEKPSVAQEFAKALKINIKKYDGPDCAAVFSEKAIF